MLKNITQAFLMGLLAFSCLLPRPAEAGEAVMETIGGADRSFTYGYAQAQEVHNFEKEILDRNAQEAAPQEPGAAIETEPLRVYRSFRVATQYDSNVFYDHHDPKDDLLYLYSPSLGFSLGKPGVTRGYLNTFYDLTYVNYSENSKLSRFNQTHTVNMGLRSGKFDIKISNQFQPASAQETGERTELAGANGNRVIAYSDNAAVNVTYHWTARTELSANYTYDFYYLPASSNENNRGVTRYSYQRNTIAPKITYQLNPKNTLYFGGSVSSSDYFKGGDLSAKDYGLVAGINHRLTPKTDVRFEAGYDWVDYNVPLYASSEGPGFGGILRHEFSPKVAGILSARRSLTQAFDYTSALGSAGSVSTKATTDSYRAELEWAATSRMTLNGYVSAEDDHRDGVFTFADPDNHSISYTQGLEDHIYSWGINWGWRPREPWAVFLSYESLAKLSSFRSLEYDEQRVGGSVRAIF